MRVDHAINREASIDVAAVKIAQDDFTRAQQDRAGVDFGLNGSPPNAPAERLRAQRNLVSLRRALRRGTRRELGVEQSAGLVCRVRIQLRWLTGHAQHLLHQRRLQPPAMPLAGKLKISAVAGSGEASINGDDTI